MQALGGCCNTTVIAKRDLTFVSERAHTTRTSCFEGYY